MESSCLSKEVCDNISADICEESIRREGGDEISSSWSFIPAKLVKDLKFLALCPHDGTNMGFATGRAQLLAFNRWKGASELPELTVFGGLGRDVADEKVFKENTDSEEDNEDGSWVPKRNKKNSLQKRKSNLKYSEDDSADDDFDGATQEMSNIEEGNKRISSRKRKPNSKYREAEGLTRSWLTEYDVDESLVYKEVKGINGNKEVSSRKRKQRAKHNEDEGESDTGLANENVVSFKGVSENVVVSSPKKMPLREDKSKTYTGLNENLNDAHGLKERKDIEWIFKEKSKGVTLGKRNPSTKYKEKEEEEDEEDVDSLESDEREDSEGNVKEDVWIAEGNKRASSRKRKTNTKYSLDGDYIYDPTEENVVFQKSQRKNLIPREYPSSNIMLSQLHITATDPMKGCALVTSLFGFFADYRNSLSQGTGNYMIIDNNFDPEIIERVTNGAGYKDEEKKKDYTPTAVILYFADVDSVPSKSDLHHVFDCYGDLNKANTEVAKKLRRARVVFKRRLDAENACKCTGRFSIFGPSLVSYRLSYFYPE